MIDIQNMLRGYSLNIFEVCKPETRLREHDFAEGACKRCGATMQTLVDNLGPWICHPS